MNVRSQRWPTKSFLLLFGSYAAVQRKKKKRCRNDLKNRDDRLPGSADFGFAFSALDALSSNRLGAFFSVQHEKSTQIFDSIVHALTRFFACSWDQRRWNNTWNNQNVPPLTNPRSLHVHPSGYRSTVSAIDSNGCGNRNLIEMNGEKSSRTNERKPYLTLFLRLTSVTSMNSKGHESMLS